MKRFREWTGEPKWNYSRRSGRGTQPGKRSRALRRSMVSAGGWCGRQCGTAGTKEDRTSTNEAGSGESAYRADADRRFNSATQAAAHSASYLDPAARGTSRDSDRRANRTPLCGDAEARGGFERRGSIRAAELHVGTGGAGRLVRSGGETGRRNTRAAVLRDAQNGIG